MATWRRGCGGGLAVRVVVTLLGVLAFSAPAHANEGLLNPGSLIIATERLMGVAHQRFSEPSVTTRTDTYNTVALFGSSFASGASLGHSMLPRIGFDGVLGPGITLTVDSRLSFANVSVELLMIASPVPHAGFIFGPFLEGALTGSRQNDVTRSSHDKVRYSAVGVTAGVCLML